MFYKRIFTIFFLSLYSLTFAQTVSPVLQFPQPDLDDSTAYANYSTRFYKDSKENTVQISIDKNIGRIINLWADAANESISFSVKDSSGKPTEIYFEKSSANISEESNKRFLEYALTCKSSSINIGLFLLGSMRIERDFRYQKRYTLPLNSDSVFIQEELINLISNIKKLPKENQIKQLKILNTDSVEELNLRLTPKISFFKIANLSSVKIEQPYFDAKNYLSLEISVNRNQNIMDVSKNMVHVYNRAKKPIKFLVKIGTNSPPLNPLHSGEIFNEKFLDFYNEKELSIKNKTDKIGKNNLLKFKRLARQVKSLELISSKEKLMAGLPNFATYFARDMMMSALMMEPIWNVSMFEYVIKSVLKKLNPDGNVSHEEGLGGQAIRENAAKYNSLLSKYFKSNNKKYQDSLLAKSAKILENLQKTTENYHMIDDDFQLPVLIAHYLANNEISNSRKIDFLKSALSKKSPVTVLQLIIKNLMYISSKTKSYAEKPAAANLISFVKNDEGYWQSASWRDSRTGYAFGRFPMDVNAIWAPKALESTRIILNFLKKNNLTFIEQSLNIEFQASTLKDYFVSPDMLDNAITNWKTAEKYFWTNIKYKDANKKIEEKLNWLSKDEKKYWERILNKLNYNKDINFLTLSLDENGGRIKVENTDPAELLFLTNFTDEVLQNKIPADSVLNLLNMFTLPFPKGLFVEGLGTLVANDTYASKQIWEAFKNDKYHSPYVIWGREVNLILIGLCKQILAGYDAGGKLKDKKLFSYKKELKVILNKIHTAVEESGLQHNELWSYKIRDGKLYPMRYETTSDIQLWNLTNLTVQYLLEKVSLLD